MRDDQSDQTHLLPLTPNSPFYNIAKPELDSYAQNHSPSTSAFSSNGPVWRSIKHHAHSAPLPVKNFFGRFLQAPRLLLLFLIAIFIAAPTLYSMSGHSENPLTQSTTLILDGVDPAKPFPAHLTRQSIWPTLHTWSKETYRAENILKELTSRYSQYGGEEQTPEPGLTAEQEERYSNLSTITAEPGKGVYIAIDLHNSVNVMRAISGSMLRAMARLDLNNLYVSIYENGSTDRTAEMLAEFGAALAAMGVKAVTVRSVPLKSNYEAVDRVVVLSHIRNEALRDLPRDNSVNTVLFSNDVVMREDDILELLYQKHIQSADQVCATDWGECKGSQCRFYDLWVARGISGNLLYTFQNTNSFSPVFLTEQDQIKSLFEQESPGNVDRWLNGAALPVYSCWNGIVALAADLFVDDGLRFRASRAQGWKAGSSGSISSKWESLVAQDGYSANDCSGSECQLLSRDIHHLRNGTARIVVAARSRTAYGIYDYQIVKDLVPLKATKQIAELIPWSEVTLPPTVACRSSRNENGNAVFEWNSEQMNLLP